MEKMRQRISGKFEDGGGREDGEDGEHVEDPGSRTLRTCFFLKKKTQKHSL